MLARKSRERREQKQAAMRLRIARRQQPRATLSTAERAARKKASQANWLAAQRQRTESEAFERMAQYLNTSEAWLRAEQRITRLYGCGTSWTLLEESFKYFHSGQR